MREISNSDYLQNLKTEHEGKFPNTTIDVAMED